MIVVVEPYNAHLNVDLTDQMFRLRARVFRDRLKWDVEVKDGKERDKYDNEAPVYIIYADEISRRVKGSLRLLPTTGPTVLGDIFADTLPDAVALSAPTIWECTRFCVEEGGGERPHREELISSGILIAALGDVAIKAGIEAVLGNFDSTMLRLYRRIGCEVEVLGADQPLRRAGLSRIVPGVAGYPRQGQIKAMDRAVRDGRG